MQHYRTPMSYSVVSINRHNRTVKISLFLLLYKRETLNMKLAKKLYKLNSKQLHLLKLAYKFRYITAPLLTQYKKQKSRKSMYDTLERLVYQNYLDKKLENNQTFQNKGTRYYLTAKGIKLLLGDSNLSKQSLHSMYKNKLASSAFIDHNIEVFKTYLHIRDNYPDKFHIFTKSEISPFGWLPETKPDMYIRRITNNLELSDEYILDLFSDVPAFVIKKRLEAYIEHYDSGEWKDPKSSSDIKHPTILIVCPDSRIEKQIQDYANRVLDSMGIDELHIYTTSLRALLSVKELEPAMWSDIYKPEKLLSL